MFQVKFKLRGETEIVVEDAIFAGMQPDYPYPMFFLRRGDGEQIEFPMEAIIYLKFSKERYEGVVE